MDIPKVLLLLAPSNAEWLAKAGEIYEQVKKQVGTFRTYLVPLNSCKSFSYK